jgi:hypothetical protein
MKDFKNLDKVVSALETYDQMKIIFNKERDSSTRYPYDLHLKDKYGVSPSSILSAYTDLWYLKGKEDAINELKNIL